MMLRNLIDQVDDGSSRVLDRSKIVRFVVHRIDFSEDDGAGYWSGVKPVPRDALDGIETAQRFRDARRVTDDERLENEYRDRPGAYTGGQNPYTFLGRYPGGVDQILRVTDYGPHAMRWSWSAVSYAVSGNFCARPGHTPHAGQWADVILMAALFCAWLGANPVDVVMGHDELPGVRAGGKECPGIYFDMHRLRWEVEAHELSRLSKQDAEKKLTDIGVVF